MDKGVVELLWRGSSHLCIVCEWTVDPPPLLTALKRYMIYLWLLELSWPVCSPAGRLGFCGPVSWCHMRTPRMLPVNYWHKETFTPFCNLRSNKCSFVSQPQISNISTSLRDIRTKILLFGRCEFLPVCLRGRKAGESLQVQRELSLGEVTMTGESFEFESELVLTNCLHTCRAKCAHSWRIDFPAWNLNLLK